MFELSDEQRLIQQTAREFAEREIWPEAARCDQEKCFPQEIAAKARELGLFNLTVPEEYGGPGLGALELALVTEQLAWGCVGLGGGISLNNLPADVLLVSGNADQKREYLGRLITSEYGSYAVTEPGAGSDVAGISTRAVRDGDGYLLNGSKVWISNAPLAGFFTVLAKTDPEAGYRGLSFFLVERDSPGLEVGNPLPKLGQNAVPAAEVFFNDVRVPREALLGNEGDGFKIAMQVFDRSRPMVAAFAVGLMQRCLDVSLAYARERKTMGQAIIHHQAIGHKLAEMEMRLQAARLMTYQAAWLLDAGKRNTLQAACAKAFAADAAMWVATETLQIFGGYGYSPEFPAEKLFRDAKVLQIYEGTSEIQRNIIARELGNR
ncbi:acyl-CoA dehydrogenase [Geothermobacter hydrogeniphilus]|uniref:Acyl-CoA dehydrogenase n=1 Tax=Geothermobacter hydrogeniphilus TaxID=1969733 RepID=A0A2K2HB61_9BACT|nr:acyl-CoA dehydrogenase family protein [Geothermobacter hydrogeniphilus]PNU20497.1 acyl-CoA dehydrogenase [Geothermobacter hydrogeniphilus]